MSFHCDNVRILWYVLLLLSLCHGTYFNRIQQVFSHSYSGISEWSYKGCFRIQDVNELVQAGALKYIPSGYFNFTDCATWSRNNSFDLLLLSADDNEQGFCWGCMNCLQLPLPPSDLYCPSWSQIQSHQNQTAIKSGFQIIYTLDQKYIGIVNELIPFSQQSLITLQSILITNINTISQSYMSRNAYANHDFSNKNNVAQQSSQQLTESCTRAFQDLINQSLQPLTWPPLRLEQLDTPSLNELSLHGAIPILEDYVDTTQNNGGEIMQWNGNTLSNAAFDNYCYRGDQLCRQMFDRYTDMIRDKRVAVIGTLKPWLEAALILAGAAHVVTIEYMPIHSSLMELTTLMPSQLASRYLAGDWTAVDLVMSFSAIEHNGLGRYGDPFDPYGDLSKFVFMASSYACTWY